MNASIKIDHVAVMVSDLEKSLHFYRDLLGLEVVSPEEHNDGPISEMVAIPKVHMREYRLRAPDGIHGHTRNEGPGFTLDLIQWLNPASSVERYPVNHVPSAHICFGVEDVPATYERLKASGRRICLATRPFHRRRGVACAFLLRSRWKPARTQ